MGSSTRHHPHQEVLSVTLGGQNPYGPPRQPNPGPYPQQPYPQPYPYPYTPQPAPASLWQRFREDEWPTLRELLRHGRRLNGCLWAVIILVFGHLLVCLMIAYPPARSARRQARKLFPDTGPYRIRDHDIVRIQRARAWLALIASFAILAVYGTAEDVAQAQDQFWLRVVITPWLLLLSAPAVVAVLLRFAPPSARAPMRARLRPVMRAALRYFGAFTALPVIVAGSYVLLEPYGGSAALALIILVVAAPTLWLLLFIAFSTPRAIRTAFNTADVHAALPALLTGVLVWEFAFLSLLIGGGMPPGPPLVRISAFLAGPASVTAVAWWEIDRMRARYGVTLRA
jgi:hypothetical protein